MATERHLIGVVGCHRSGTSALTRGMRALSGVIGEDLLPPVEGNNPTGFWEDRELHVLLQDIQRSAGSDWDELTYGLEPRHEYVLRAAKDDLSAFFDSRTSSEYPYVFKNPRATLMLPMLHEVFGELGVVPSYVLAVRDPLSVAESLHSRDGLPLELGCLLWLRYTTAAVTGTAGSDRVVVRYDTYLEEPEAQLRRIELALDVPNLALRPSELRRIADDFLRPDLQHHHHDVDNLRASRAVSDEVVAAFEDLTRVAALPADSDETVDEELWRGLDELVAARRPEWAMIDETRRAAKNLATVRDELAEVDKKHAAAMAERAEVHAQETGRWQAEVERLAAEADRLMGALEANSSALESARSIMDDQIEAVRQEADASIRAAELEVQARDAQIAELDAAASKLLVERDAARTKAASGGGEPGWNPSQSSSALQAEIDAIKSSTSWRVTKPLRLVGDVAKTVRRR